MYLTFTNPIYLWLLISIPLFVISHFYFLKRSKSKAIRFANFETLRRLGQEKILTKNIAHLIIRIIILLALIISASGTEIWYKGMSSATNYVVALDTSASMTAEDLQPNRLRAAKEYISSFNERLSPDTKIGLVAFSGITTIEQYPTDSKLEFKIALDKTDISKTGGTDIAGAIITATNLLEQSDTETGKAILLVTDGVNTVNTFVADSIKESVKYAKEHQVIIHSIGIGSNTGPLGYLPEYYNISASYSNETLQYMSDETGGKYINALTVNELEQAYRFLGEQKKEKYIKINVSFGAMLLAIALLFIEWGLSNTIYRRIM
jgi:Ca-activated chloride channel homolog